MTVKRIPSADSPGDFVGRGGLGAGGGRTYTGSTGGKSIVTGKKSSVSKKAKEKLESKHPRSGKGKRSRDIPISEKGKGYYEQKYKTTIKVKVKHKDGSTHTDEIKGMNEGHALARAKSNWPGAAVVKIK